MAEFYTNFNLKGNTFYVSGYRDGVRFREKNKVKSCAVRTTSSNGKLPASEYKTIDGKNLYTIDFDNVFDMRKFIRENKVHMPFYGMSRYEYTLIDEMYPGAYGIETYDASLIKSFFFDIEVETEGSYATTTNPFQRVNLITIVFRGNVYAIGLEPYTPKKENVKYLYCKTEEELLMSFFKLLQKIDPDVLSGYNITEFDIPYLINRCKRVFGDDVVANKFSPFGICESRTLKGKYGEVEVYDILGLEVLDYLPLYKKFQLTKTIDYKLHTVAMYELGEGKVDFSEEGSLRTLYQTNWEKFVDYGIKDSELVYMIDKKRNYINLAIQIAMRSKCNYNDVFFQTRLWEQIIYTYLISEEKVVSPIKSVSGDGEEYEGAYVKPPLVGLHEWVVYYDFTSLYPHIMMSLNLSPETFVGMRDDISVQDVLDMNLDKIDTESLVEQGVCMAANGALFRTDKLGFIPKILKKMFAERKEAKKTMLQYQKGVDMIKEELKKRGVAA